MTCAVCETRAFFVWSEITDSPGAPDLDFRPAEPARSTMLGWVQRCASCGYCARRIDESPDEVEEVVASEAYRTQLVEAGLPELARSLLCVALLAEWYGDEAEAARCAVEAAWVCDDAAAFEAASRCRLRAVALVYEAEAEGNEIFPDPYADHALIVDLYRRAGSFEDAIRQADSDLVEAGCDFVELLGFSRMLAIAGDSGAYSMDDIASAGTDDRAIIDALKQLGACRERGEHEERFIVLGVDKRRNYFVQFAVDEGGLLFEVVHNRYLAAEDAFTGDDISTLLALGFHAPVDDHQNLFRVFDPACDGDFEAIVGLVRTIVTDFFGLPPTHPLQLSAEFGEPALS
ncbi:MAG: hypothetical protein ABI317_13585 [Gaiellales bacterium]